MTLAKLSVKKIEYWAMILKDEHRPDGEEYPTRFASEEEAQAKVDRMVKIELGVRECPNDTQV